MYCVNCGRPYDDRHKFCNYCGHSLPDVQVAELDSSSDTVLRNPIEIKESLLEPSPAGTNDDAASTDVTLCKDSTAAPKKAPFRRFVICYIALLISLCGLLLASFEYHASLGVTYQTTSLSRLADTLYVVCIAAVFTSALSILRTWNQISYDGRAKRVAVIGFAYLLVVALLSSVFGAAVGHSRRTFIAVQHDIDSVNEVAGRIRAARNAEMVSISDYIDCYRRLEPDVLQYERLNLKLESDLETYQERFPEHKKTTTENLASTRVELRRATLLKQQITAIKKIDGLDHDSQVLLWRSSVLPLFQQEERLD